MLVQGMVVDGSPNWQVLRVVPLELGSTAAPQGAATSSAAAPSPARAQPPATSSGLLLPSVGAGSGGFDDALIAEVSKEGGFRVLVDVGPTV